MTWDGDQLALERAGYGSTVEHELMITIDTLQEW